MISNKGRLTATLVATITAILGTGSAVAIAASEPSAAVTFIDAKAEPGKAARVMEMYPTATYKKFTPTADPAFSETPWRLASQTAVAAGPNEKAATETIVASHSAGASISLSESISVSAKTSILGAFTAKVSAGFTRGQVWATQTSDTTSITATASPGTMVSVYASNSQVTVTGDFQFTVDNKDYVVAEVTSTLPAVQDGDTGTEVSYKVLSQPYQAPATKAMAHSNRVRISDTPGLQSKLEAEANN